MKKILIIATAALLFSGVTFAQDGGNKKTTKSSCKKSGNCCKDKAKQDKSTKM